MGLKRHVKAGLTAEDHRQLGMRLRQLKAELLALRTTIKASLGSADSCYTAATGTLSGLGRLQSSLLQEAASALAGEVPIAALRALYDGEGEGCNGGGALGKSATTSL